MWPVGTHPEIVRVDAGGNVVGAALVSLAAEHRAALARAEEAAHPIITGAHEPAGAVVLPAGSEVKLVEAGAAPANDGPADKSSSAA